MKNLKIRDMVLTALIIAITFIAAKVIQIPNGMSGFIHPGDAVVLIAPILIGKKKGIFAAATGMMLVDLLSGFAIYAPFTFVIKAIMAWISYSIYIKRNTIKNKIMAFSLSAIFMVVGYFITDVVILYFINREAESVIKAIVAALAGVPGNIVQGVTAIILALIMSKMLIKYKKQLV